MNKKEKSICFVTNPGNGISELIVTQGLESVDEMRIFKLAKYYIKHGYKIYFLTFDKTRIDIQMDNVEFLSNYKRYNSLVYAIMIPFLFYKKLKKVMCYNPRQMSASLYAIYLKLFFGGKVITRCGYDWDYFIRKSSKNFFYKIFVKIWCYITYKLSDALYVTSKVHYSKALKYTDKTKLFLIRNAVNEEIFKRNENKKIRAKSILCVGRLEKQKNFDSVIRACKGLTDFEIHFAGNGSLKTELQNLAKKLNVKCIFHNTVDKKTIVKLHNACGIFILPSFYEGMSNALVEAMFVKSVIIASNIEANAEVIESGVSGILCGHLPDEIRKSIIMVMDDEELRQKLSKNAYKRAIELFRFNDMADKKIKIFNKILFSKE